MKIHPIRINFQVTEEVKRYVFVYLIEAKYCYLIDAGVAGCQELIVNKLKEIGRELSDIRGIFLTHSHPDHIGTAGWFREQTACNIYASQGEKEWIEDIEKQYRERPIPNFHRLAGQSVPVDVVVKDGDCLMVEEDVCLRVMGTPGHAKDEVAYQLGNAIFVGDCIPVLGDIPIYVDPKKTLDSMKKLAKLEEITCCYPAWDTVYDRPKLQQKLAEGVALVQEIENVVRLAETHHKEQLTQLVDLVCRHFNQPAWKHNPLFARTLLSHVTENR